MAPKKGKEIISVKGEEAEDLVKNYLKDQYRPYAVPDLVLNLHNKVNKSSMTKALESLVANGDIISKTYGKSIYYVYKEEYMEDTEGSKIDEKEIEGVREAIFKIDETLKEMNRTYEDLILDPSNQEASIQIQILSQEISGLESKLKEFQSDTAPRLSKEELNMAKSYSKALENIYNQRKNIFHGFLGMISEGVEDFNKLMNEIGIDLDDVKEIKQMKF